MDVATYALLPVSLRPPRERTAPTGTTLAVGERGNVPTASGAATIYAPASPADGAEFIVKDADGSAATNAITLDGNGKNIDGTSTCTLNVASEQAAFVYDGTEWVRQVVPRTFRDAPASPYVPVPPVMLFRVRDIVAAGAVSLSSGVSGVLGIANGGTGLSSIGASGTVLQSNGSVAAWTAPSISLTTQVTGVLPVANGGTGISSFGAGVATFLGTPSSANLAAAVTDETGSGALVFGTSPTITTPTLQTPAISSPVVTGSVQRQGTNADAWGSFNEAQTASTTTTSCGSYIMADESSIAIDAIVGVSRRTNVTKAGRFKRSAVYTRTGGGAPTLVGSIDTGMDQTTGSGDAVTFDVSGNTVRVRVTAGDADNRNWSCELRVQETRAT